MDLNNIRFSERRVYIIDVGNVWGGEMEWVNILRSWGKIGGAETVIWALIDYLYWWMRRRVGNRSDLKVEKSRGDDLQWIFQPVMHVVDELLEWSSLLGGKHLLRLETKCNKRRRRKKNIYIYVCVCVC